MKKKIVGYLIAAAMLLLAAVPAHAAGNARIVELKQKDGQLLACVKGAENIGEVTAMLGRTPVENVKAQSVLEAGIEMHTLILIDNSLSIPEDNRTAIQEKLLDLAAARRENEYFALGTISDHVTVLLDFTKDYTQLKNALETLEYQYQDTFITDALYDYLATNPFAESENAFERILLISDGVDNKSLGYTKDELLGVLKDAPLPLYAVGIQNWNENNDEELENMFALARTNNGETFLLNDLISGSADLASALDANWSNLAVTVDIPESVQDGSLQTLTLQFGESGAAASLDNIRMPLLAQQPLEPEPEPEPKPVPEPEPEPELEPEPEPKQELNLPLLIALGAALAAVVVLAVLLLRKKKSVPLAEEETNKEKRDPQAQPTPQSTPADRRTVLVGGAADGGDTGGRRTVRVLGQRPVCNIVLKDVHNPDKFYQKTIEKSLLVGALPDSDICINYDSTVSGRHCEIILDDGELYLVNHSRSNGTDLNGQPVTQKTRLTSGSIIKMGLVEMSITFNP